MINPLLKSIIWFPVDAMLALLTLKKSNIEETEHIFFCKREYFITYYFIIALVILRLLGYNGKLNS